MYEIELAEHSISTCNCCGGLSVRLTRFVYLHGNAFATYYATYSNKHPDNELAMLVSLGELGENSATTQRAAFYYRVRPANDSYEVMIGDAAQSAWRDADIVGEKLSRESALRHPWKARALEVLDEAVLHDPSLQGFLRRVQCGDPSIPLEETFHMPDELFALGSERRRRAEIRRHLASLDGERFFVRCFLPITIEGYKTWCVGLWVEVSRLDYDCVSAAWNDPVAYSTLRFSGRIANEMAAKLDLPIALGVQVELHVSDADAPPMIATSTDGPVASVLSTEWSKVKFEQYAVSHGFL
jgi:hypothetical protein